MIHLFKEYTTVTFQNLKKRIWDGLQKKYACECMHNEEPFLFIYTDPK